MSISFAQWSNWSKDGSYKLLPYIRTWNIEAEQGYLIQSWLDVWHKHHPYAALLESGKGGRYTVLGLSPVEAIYGTLDEGFVQAIDNGVKQGEPERYTLPPLNMLRHYMSKLKAPRLDEGPKYKGGIMGYLGYDLVRSIEKLPTYASDDLDIPVYYMLRFNDIWVYDEVKQQFHAITHYELPSTDHEEQLLKQAYAQAGQRTYEMQQELQQHINMSGQASSSYDSRKAMQAHIEQHSLHINLEEYEGLEPTTTKQQFMSAVNTIKDYIAAGDVFQVNLSQRQRKQTDIDGKQLYEWLRLFNPSPYMSYFSTPELQIVSASPELLVEVRDGVLATRPIAGTRRRGKTAEEEEQFVQELLTSEKEKAEHIMLVDLERNDLGRVSRYGTVQVKELMVIERYSHVMHLVSQIEGELQQGKDCFDVIAATFPGGTITGAPKIRTMEIIEELEPVRRGVYTGSIGHIDYCGDMELNIVIRTMLIKDGYAYVQAGAGIVIDSEPHREYYESLNKAKALWKALQYAETYEQK